MTYSAICLLLTCLFLTSCKGADQELDFAYSYYLRMEEIRKIGISNVVFLGDSLTSQHIWNGANMGIAGDTIDGVRNRLEYVRRADPARVFLTIGTNDIYSGDPDLMAYNLDAYIVKPMQKQKIDVVVTTIPFMLDDSPERKNFNSKIHQFNEKLRQAYSVIDLNVALAEKGNLPKRFTTDGVHLSEEAYRVWENLISQKEEKK